MLRSSFHFKFHHHPHQQQQQQRKFVKFNASNDPAKKFTAQITRAHTWEESCVIFNDAIKFLSKDNNTASNNHNDLQQYWLRALLRRCGRSDWKTCLNVYSKVWTTISSTNNNNQGNVLTSDSTRASLAYGTLVNWRVSLAIALSTPNLINKELEPLSLNSSFSPLEMPFIASPTSVKSNNNAGRKQDIASTVLPIFDTALRGASQAGAWSVCLQLFQQSGFTSHLKYRDFVSVPSSNQHTNNNSKRQLSLLAGSFILVFARVALSTMIALVGYEQNGLSLQNIFELNEKRREFVAFADQLYTSFTTELKTLHVQAPNAELSLMVLRFHVSYCFILNNLACFERAIQVCQEAPWELQERPSEAFPHENVVGLVSRSLSETRWSIILRALVESSNSNKNDEGDNDPNQAKSYFTTKAGKASSVIIKNMNPVRIAEYVIRLRKNEAEQKNWSQQKYSHRNNKDQENLPVPSVSPKALVWERTFCIEATSINTNNSNSSSENFQNGKEDNTTNTSSSDRLQRAIDTWYLSIVSPLENPTRTDVMRMKCSFALANVLRYCSSHKNKNRLAESDSNAICVDGETGSDYDPKNIMLEKIREANQLFVEVYPGEQAEKDKLVNSSSNNFNPLSTSWSASLLAFSKGFETEIQTVSFSDVNRVWLLPILCVVAADNSCPLELGRRALERALEILEKLAVIPRQDQNQASPQQQQQSPVIVQEHVGEAYLQIVQTLISRKRDVFQPVPSKKIKSVFYSRLNNEIGDELCSPKFRDAPWVFFTQIALCLELRSPCVNQDELCQRWMLALKAFESWKAHEVLNLEEMEKTAKQANNNNKQKSSLVLLNVHDIEDALDERGEEFGQYHHNHHHSVRNHFSSAARKSSEIQQQISLSSALHSVQQWLKSHKLHDVADKMFTRALPLNDIDKIVSAQIINLSPHRQQQNHSSNYSKVLAEAILTKTSSLIMSNEEIDDQKSRLQQSLIKMASANQNSENVLTGTAAATAHHLLQTAVFLRKLNNNNNNGSIVDNPHNNQLMFPSFVPNLQSWSRAMISEAMKPGGSWQHAHFLFLRSLHSLSLEQMCDFVEFELERLTENSRKNNSNMKDIVAATAEVADNNINGGRPIVNTAMMAVAIGIIPKLASFSSSAKQNEHRTRNGENDEIEQQEATLQSTMKRNDARNLTYAARVGVKSFLSCGMWRSAINFASSTLEIAKHNEVKRNKGNNFCDEENDGLSENLRKDEQLQKMVGDFCSCDKIPELTLLRLLK